MACFGALLIILGLPLMIGFYIGGQKNIMWRNLGLVMGVVGLLIVFTGGMS